MRPANDEQLAKMVHIALNDTLTAFMHEVQQSIATRLLAAVPKVETEIHRRLCEDNIEIHVFINGIEQKREAK